MLASPSVGFVRLFPSLVAFQVLIKARLQFKHSPASILSAFGSTSLVSTRFASQIVTSSVRDKSNILKDTESLNSKVL